MLFQKEDTTLGWVCKGSGTQFGDALWSMIRKKLTEGAGFSKRSWSKKRL
jgi:hypothetical protein